MNEDHKSDFRIRLDEDEPTQSFFHSRVDNQQISKLRRRITFMSFFTLCLVAIALTFAYLDIKKRVGGFSGNGAGGFETLSQEVESRFSSLSVKYAEIEAKSSKKISTLENSVASVKKGFDKTAASLKKSVASMKKSLQTVKSSKADQKVLSNLKKETSAGVAVLQKEMEKFASMLQTMDSEYNEVLAEFQQELEVLSKKNFALQDSLLELTALTDHTPIKEKIEADLHAQSLDFQNKVDELTTLLNRNDDKIENLLGRVKVLRKDFTKVERIATSKSTAGLPANPVSNDGVKEQNIQ